LDILDAAGLHAYLQEDVIGRLAARSEPASLYRALACQRWMDSTPAKRFAFSRLYGDLLGDDASARRVLDVGGGLSAMTPFLAAKTDYVLLDPLHHDAEPDIASVGAAAAPFSLIREDWHRVAFDGAVFDVIIANDLFPNVDQRLALFISWALARTRELRLALTFHNTPRWYETRRTDGEERLTMLAFDGARTRDALVAVADRIAGWNPALFDAAGPSLFPNGRHVVIATIRGEA
jgi:hypothetical protein